MTVMEAQLAQMPRSAIEAAEIRAKIIARVLAMTRRLWNPLRPTDPSAWLARWGELYELTVAEAQAELVLLAAASVDIQLAEQRYRGGHALTADPDGFVGVAGDGRPVMGLAYVASQKVAGVIDAPELDIPLGQAWQSAFTTLMLVTQTTLSDTSRVAKSVQMTARPGTGWIRMVRPPCCSRCAILAGKKGRSPSVGFDRHPGCDCDAVPIANYKSSSRKDWIFDTREYFFSLDDAEQEKIFTKAGAKAIRDGADPAQVVNARRGMSTAADSFGVQTTTTTEGTTKRGWASDYLRKTYDAQMRKHPGERYSRTSRPRLMPEEIYKIAGDDTDMALNLLHKNGFLTDASTDLSGRWSWAIRDQDVLDAQQRTFRRLVRS